MDISSVTAALGGLKSAIDFVRVGIAARDDVKMRDAFSKIDDRFIDVQQKSIAIQQENLLLIQKNLTLVNEHQTLVKDKFTLSQKNHELIQRIADLEKAANDLEEYEPYRTARGGTVFRQKKLQRGDTEPVYLCADCASMGKKTFLQPDTYLWLRCSQHGKFASDVPEYGSNVSLI